MATTQPNGARPDGAAAPAGAGPQVRILGQFIRDLSFENPSSGRVAVAPGEQPNLRVEVNVNPQSVGANVYESAIELKAHCSVAAGVLYDLELVYSSVMSAEGVPPEMLDQFLLIHCPSLAFPFLRRLAADITREGGFPPLLLDPIDFAGLYTQRRLQAGQTSASVA